FETVVVGELPSASEVGVGAVLRAGVDAGSNDWRVLREILIRAQTKPLPTLGQLRPSTRSNCYAATHASEKIHSTKFVDTPLGQFLFVACSTLSNRGPR